MEKIEGIFHLTLFYDKRKPSSESREDIVIVVREEGIRGSASPTLTKTRTTIHDSRHFMLRVKRSSPRVASSNQAFAGLNTIFLPQLDGKRFYVAIRICRPRKGARFFWTLCPSHHSLNMFFEMVLALLFQILVSPAFAIPLLGVEEFPTRVTVNQPLTLTWFRETSDLIATLEVIRGVEGGQSITTFGEANRVIISVGTRTRGAITITPTITGILGLNLQADQFPVTTPTEDIQTVPSPPGTPTTSSPSTSITESSTTSSNTAQSPKKLSTKLIVGHAVGGIAGLSLILLGGYLIWRRIRLKNRQLENGQLTVAPFREPKYPSPGPCHPDIRTVTPVWKDSLARGSPSAENSRSLPPRIELDGIPFSQREDERSEVLVRREQDGGRIHSLEVVLPPQYDIRWCNTSGT
ncbi:hypothetical protein L218DRAFT_991980 [Marasmius fiardii PR-910]|nr:hypothetical protein L218DRAFT_991980 [Marasmius fiardii PR-910]